MNVSFTIWRCMIVLLILYSNCCLLFPAVFISQGGYLTVEPAPLFLMGSNLTVYCHKCPSGSKIFLVLNEKIRIEGKTSNCTTKFYLPRIWSPLSTLWCVIQTKQTNKVETGLDLRAGLPPDKPADLTCQTERNSDLMNCSWSRGQETYISTFYNITVSRNNGTQIHSDHIQDKGGITIPSSMLDENTTYILIVVAHNHFGVNRSDPFTFSVKDTVIPDTPHIKQIEFESKPIAAILHWSTTESSKQLRAFVRLHTNISWEIEGAQLSQDLIRVDNLSLLTEYEFQVKTCRPASGLVGDSTSSSTTVSPNSGKTSICSKWSPGVRMESPGKGPSQLLHVWRQLGSQRTNGHRTVTVMWKPLPSEDYSGQLQEYKILFPKNLPAQNCAARLNQCEVEIPAEIQTLTVSAVTAYGMSPPAEVALTHSGALGPDLGYLTPAANGTAVLITWSWLKHKHLSTTEGKLLYYVMEWESVPSAGKMQWQKLSKDLTSFSVAGLWAGVRYRVALYAVTTSGVSTPSTSLIYSKEQKPDSGPNMYVLVHEASRILIRWDELPVGKQRGFITKYTIYFQPLDSSSKELSETVPGSVPRQMWLDCPEGALALQITASTSAGEGPRGRRISSQPAAPAVGMVIVIIFVISTVIAIIANLMCWSCVRKRIKQTCVNWGPGWLVDRLPKPGHSNAIKLLEHDGSEPNFSSNDSDPPLSPITVIPQDREEVYPTVHIEVPLNGTGDTREETLSLISAVETQVVGSLLEHASYKPQIAALAPERDEVNEAKEDQGDMTENEEEVKCSSTFEGLLGGLLLSIDVESVDPTGELTVGSVSEFLWPKLSDASVLNKGFLQDGKGTEDGEEADSHCVGFQQDDITDMCSPQCTGVMSLNGGYFPQVAPATVNKL
ncbi:interleukin-23 receptor isoform 2-T2 [Pholidichthys leucotaenia]